MSAVIDPSEIPEIMGMLPGIYKERSISDVVRIKSLKSIPGTRDFRYNAIVDINGTEYPIQITAHNNLYLDRENPDDNFGILTSEANIAQGYAGFDSNRTKPVVLTQSEYISLPTLKKIYTEIMRQLVVDKIIRDNYNHELFEKYGRDIPLKKTGIDKTDINKWFKENCI